MGSPVAVRSCSRYRSEEYIGQRSRYLERRRILLVFVSLRCGTIFGTDVSDGLSIEELGNQKYLRRTGILLDVRALGLALGGLYKI